MTDENKKMSNEEIEELVKSSKQGDKDAFAKLYDIFLTPIYRYIYYKVNREDVEDLTEITFFKIWQNLKKYNNRKGSTFSSWIFRIAHNAIMDHYRSHRSISELPVTLSDEKRDNSPVLTTENVLNSNILRYLLNKLKKNYKQVLILKYINQLSNEEIAEIMKKKVGSVRVLQFRALNALRALIEEEKIKF